MLDGIVDADDQCLLEAAEIGVDMDAVVAQIEPDGDLARFGQGFALLHGGGDDFVEPGFGDDEVLRLGIGAGEADQVVEQLAQFHRLALDAFQRLALLLRIAAGAQGDIGFAAQDGQGRAQLVADIGKELGAAAVDIAQAFIGLPQLAGARVDFRAQLFAGFQQAGAMLLDGAGHVVEALRQGGEFVAALQLDAVIEIALRNGLCARRRGFAPGGRWSGAA